MIRYPLAKDGVFWTIQGEGALRGKPMVFVRLAGCSVGCPQCDTDYRVAERVSVDEILQRVLKAQKRTPRNEDPRWVWVTGGEPTDHDLNPLFDGLHGIQCSIALATSGIRSVARSGVGFLSVSPHRLPIKQTNGTELKVVPGLNGMELGPDVVDLAEGFIHRYVQPLWADSESLRQCVRWVLDHPGWMLTDQGHKSWGLP